MPVFPSFWFSLLHTCILYSLSFQFACVTLCRGRPEAEGICQVAVKQTGGPEIIIQRWETESSEVLWWPCLPVSGRQPTDTDDLSLRPGLFRSLAHPAFQSIHDQSCQSLTSDGKVRPCFMMMITQTKYVIRWWPLCRLCWPAASWSAPRPWVRSSGSSTQDALTPRSSTSEPSSRSRQQTVSSQDINRPLCCRQPSIWSWQILLSTLEIS